jgi:sugar O-acyltransferase (sialic acid O-acetyltransferase NeuD family)
MEIEKLTILGLSEGTLTMILDILDSQEIYPDIDIINNLNLIPNKKYCHPKFNIEITNDVDISNKMVTLGVVKPKIRKIVSNIFEVNKDTLLVNLISDNSDISNTVKLGNGIVINTLVSIAGHTKIGDFVFINRNVSIGHHTVIGEYTTINPGVNIAGNVIIGEGCQIGIGANIIDGVKIGDNTIIGAGSLVTKDIPDNVVVYGNPCKIIRENNNI